jgi:hypothetical protein
MSKLFKKERWFLTKEERGSKEKIIKCAKDVLKTYNEERKKSFESIRENEKKHNEREFLDISTYKWGDLSYKELRSKADNLQSLCYNSNNNLIYKEYKDMERYIRHINKQTNHFKVGDYSRIPLYQRVIILSTAFIGTLYLIMVNV